MATIATAQNSQDQNDASLSYRQCVEQVVRVMRMSGRLQEYGISFCSKRELLKITDARYCYRGSGKELIDGKCHYQQQLQLEGNTYGVKEIAKSHGYRWNGRCWWKPASREASQEMTAISELVCRAISKGDVKKPRKQAR
jgi:hypothetical protein